MFPKQKKKKPAEEQNIDLERVMDSYIVRVYRRGKKGSDQIAGLVEEVGSSERCSFQTLKGLISTVKQVIGQESHARTDVPYETDVDNKLEVNPLARESVRLVNEKE